MSVKVMTWAWEQRVGSTTGKLVLMKLADNADDSACGFPSIERIARQCEINERTVQRTIRRLEAAGYLRVEARYKSGRRTSNAYYLNIPRASGGKLPPPAPPPPLPPAAVPPPPPATTTARGDTGATLTTTEPSNKEPPPRYVQRDRDYDPVPVSLIARLPDAIQAEARASLSRLPAELAQVVADEWSANLRRGNVRNPMAYLTTLIKRARAGQFTPELADQERARREAQSAAQDSAPTPSGAVDRPQLAAPVRQVTAQLARQWRNTAARDTD